MKISISNINLNIKENVKEKLDELFLLANLMDYKIKEGTMELGSSDGNNELIEKYYEKVPFYEFVKNDKYTLAFLVRKDKNIEYISGNKNNNQAIFYKDNEDLYAINEVIRDMK